MLDTYQAVIVGGRRAIILGVKDDETPDILYTVQYHDDGSEGEARHSECALLLDRDSSQSLGYGRFYRGDKTLL
jgi:hypothetical protein